MTNNETAILVIEGDLLRGVVGEVRASGEVERRKTGSWSMTDDVPASSSDSLADAASALTSGDDDAGSVAADDTPRVRAFRAAREELGITRAVLGVPMSRLIVQVLNLPVETRNDLAEVAALQLEKKAPCSANEMTVSCEILRESAESLTVFAAAFPDSEAEGFARDAELAGLELVRVDIPILGWFRAMCSCAEMMDKGRKVILSKMNADWNILVVQDGIPVFARTAGDISVDALPRETLLSTIEAEEIGSGDDISEVVVFSPSQESGDEVLPKAQIERLQTMLGVPVRISVATDCYLSCDGLMLRSGETMSLDLTPVVWKDERAAKKLGNRIKIVSIAISAIALTAIAGLLAAPWVFGLMTDRQRKLSRGHAVAYKSVSDTREKVRLIESYTDRSSSAIEMLRTVSTALSQGITLTSFSYRRQDAVKISAEADASQDVYAFKDALAANSVFVKVDLVGPSLSRNGKYRFEVNAFFNDPEEGKRK